MSKKDKSDRKYHSGKSGDEERSLGHYRPYPLSGPMEGYAYEEEDEIDLAELAGQLWRDRIFIAKLVGVFALIGVFIAIFSSVEYEVDTVLLPEVQSSQSSAGSLLQKYGGLLGISGGSAASQSGTIPPQIYPKIIQSTPYQLELMHRRFYFPEYDTTVTLQTFFQDIYRPSLLSTLGAYTFGLPGKILQLFRGDQESEEHFVSSPAEQDSIVSITRDEWSMIKQLRNRIQVTIDQETGVITFAFTMPTSHSAASVAEAGIGLLKEYVRDYRTQNAKKNLKFIKKQAEETGRDFKKAQQNLANYRDSNINPTSARAQSRVQELQSEYDLAFNTYNAVRQQLERAKLRVQEQTPVFSVLQPATVPLNKSQPNRKLIVLVFIILGIIVGFGWSLTRSWSSEFFERMKSE